MNLPFLNLLYDEPDPSTYRGVQLRMGDTKDVFDTGNPTVDYITAGCVAYTRAGGQITIQGSSDIDHFVMDGGVLNDNDPTDEEIAAGHAAARKHLKLK